MASVNASGLHFEEQFFAMSREVFDQKSHAPISGLAMS